MTTQSAVKFRPSLSISDMRFIKNALIPLPQSPQRNTILESFNRMILKAEHGIVNPSHLALGKPSIESSLGFASEDHTIETLMDAWNSNPSMLSQSQIARIQHHRYVNDMMSKDEEHDYEQLNGDV